MKNILKKIENIWKKIEKNSGIIWKKIEKNSENIWKKYNSCTKLDINFCAKITKLKTVQNFSNPVKSRFLCGKTKHPNFFHPKNQG